ncbi:NAD(P)-dependent oxidoreductase [Frankia sp. CNm7]|uniref:NAD(P)-dependent oxidoreductase n=1 Tax=Frankia nepalensis TaxID=1836974 RepID=A0A937RJF9_9ACTN|nr:NAD(P)-binding domain-containing protein [Frankia nepalensis]MBL7501125.1 NAD(P)-dependent oxidoreductase [Frankia nepalensis]MBL7515079.1 NAD(P)-dependent oxidoreductase [Frankia nepalensis]MBL7518789.1 NAD(P)-dependent oxidoreductase [Frankia nepalensis]MBL7631297.1 NAD(P)-dependent oxidoreductase [Frankia nepalensis]
MAETVGIIGLGLIGGALAERLATTGNAPVVHDLRAEAVDAAVAAGAVRAGSARELGERCDLVLIAVRDDSQCVEVVSDVVDGAHPGTVIAVLSTVTPETVTRLAAQASARGMHLVDAPLAGQGRASVLDATMSVLVGGPEDVVARLLPTFERFAASVVPTGPIGSGAALKLAHNVMVYLGYAAVVEAVELAAAAGVRDGLVEQVTRHSGTLSAQSEIFLRIYERRRHGIGTEEEDEVMRVSATLLDKDLRHAVAVAREHGQSLPVSELLQGTGENVYLARRRPRPRPGGTE